MTSDNGTSGDFNGINLVNHFHAYYGKDYLQVQIPGQTTIQDNFEYDGYGRLSSATYNGYSANYGYLANSDLWQTTTFKNGSTPKLTTTRTWEYGFRLGVTDFFDSVLLAKLASHGFWRTGRSAVVIVGRIAMLWSYACDGFERWSSGSTVAGRY